MKMSIQYSLRQNGFRNFPASSQPEGFELLLQTQYYRGVALSLVEDIIVKVDGDTFPREAVRVRIGDGTYTLDEMEHIGDVHWPWLEAATVIVACPGGMKPGLHDVEVALKLRISYMPFNPVVFIAADKLVLMDNLAARPAPKLCASLYSYNGDLQAGTMSLEECLADLSDMGNEGVEFLPEAIVPDYPNPPKAWLKQWFQWMEKYNLTPVALDGGADTKLYRNRTLSLNEIVKLIVQDLKLANKLGCKIYRGLGSSWPSALGQSCNVSSTTTWSGITPFQIYEKVLKTAEKLDVKIGEELHIPFLIRSDWLEQTIEFIDKKGTQHLGFLPDMSIFVRRPPQALSPEMFIAGGLPKPVVDYIYESRENGVPEEEAKAKVLEMNGGPRALPLTAMVYHLTYSTRERNETDQLAKLVPYTVHIHAKFYDVLEDLSDEHSIPYSEIVPVLAKAGYSNYLSSEYEGDRTPYAAPNQVRRQQMMLRQLWQKSLQTS